jgi:radical SAM protein with 4Fe4S-binding SPASM domain
MDRDLAILYDGWAYPCPFVRDNAYRLGNVVHEPIADIWTGLAATRFQAEKATRSTKHCTSTPAGSGPVPIAIRPRRSTAVS